MIIDKDKLKDIRQKHKDKKIVLTTGTFDLFHVGHLNYLKNVKSYGDVMIVLLSGDLRVKSRKGQKRPIIPEYQRALILDAIRYVDYVLIDPSKMRTDQIDPIHLELLNDLDPDLYVTDGPDPRFFKILEKSKFIILDRIDPLPSTSNIIERIVKLGI